MIPTNNAQAEVMRAGKSISIGALLPYSCLKRATLVGTMCNAAVFITTNRAISFVAIKGLLLSFCISRIASNPNGVAAFPRPNIFAVIFMDIASFVYLLFMFGKSSLSTGVSSLHNFCVIPLAVAISEIPLHKAIIPASFSVRVTASVPAESMDSDNSFIDPFFILQKKESITITTIM